MAGRRLAKKLLISSALLMIMAACAQTTPEAEPTVPPMEEPMEAQPSITMEDQDGSDGVVVIAEAMMTEPGWVVIHADQEGSPGPVIGYAPLEEGTNTDVEVTVDTGLLTGTLYAMLHVDTGQDGTYEFPDADPPVQVENEIVVEPFIVVTGMGGMGPEMEAQISMENISYSPQQLSVEAGTTVVWTNNEGLPHTVTSGERASLTDLFDSGNISAGETFSYTFEAQGTYSYFCTIHPGMSGTIIVE